MVLIAVGQIVHTELVGDGGRPRSLGSGLSECCCGSHNRERADGRCDPLGDTDPLHVSKPLWAHGRPSSVPPSLFVTEEYRGLRISEKLIARANEYLREQGFTRSYIPSVHVGLYERYGYSYVREITNYGGTDDHLYVKDFR